MTTTSMTALIVRQGLALAGTVAWAVAGLMVLILAAPMLAHAGTAVAMIVAALGGVAGAAWAAAITLAVIIIQVRPAVLAQRLDDDA